MTPESAHQQGKRLAELARPRYGVFTREQAEQCGYRREQVQRRLAQGEWRALHRDVFVSNLGPVLPLTLLSADLRFAGERAWASHLSAAHLHRVEIGRVSPDRWLTTPVGVVVPRRPGLQPTRSRRLEGVTGTVQGLPCLSLSRTVVDLARVLDRRSLTLAVADVCRRTGLTADSLTSAAEGLGGRVGVALLHVVLEEFDPLHESCLEAELLPLLVQAGFEELVPQFEIFHAGRFIARVDFADERRKQAFEADGWAFHSDPAALARDRQRDRALRQAGWDTTRFLTHQIRREQAAVVREARERRLSAPVRAA